MGDQTRSVLVRLRAEVGDFVSAMNQATSATKTNAGAQKDAAAQATAAAKAQTDAAKAVSTAAAAEEKAQAAAAAAAQARTEAAQAQAAAVAEASVENVAAARAAEEAVVAAAAAESAALAEASVAARASAQAQSAAADEAAAAQAKVVAANQAATRAFAAQSEAVAAEAAAQRATLATQQATAQAAEVAAAAQATGSEAAASAATFAAAAAQKAAFDEAAAYGKAASAAQAAAAAQVEAGRTAAAAATEATTVQEAQLGLAGRLVQAADSEAASFGKVGTAALGLGAVLGLGVGAAVKEYTDFDEAMSQVAADTHDTSDALSKLRTTAIQQGADTRYSATEAAQGVDELAKAGVSTADILSGGLQGALSIAAAGGLSVADSAQDAASAMVQFGLSGKDLPHVADELSAAANKAQGSVSDIAEALTQVGLPAHQFGLSLNDTVGTLAAFANNGLIGEKAGTSFKQMLIALANPTAQTAEEMQHLGINAYDAQGKFIGITALAGQLQKQLGGLTQEQRNQAEAQIFGTHAIQAASILYQEGAKGIQGWIDKTNDSGYAAETAAKKLDNLKGDLEYLKGDLSSAFISSGSGANAGLRSIVQDVDGAVSAFNALPAPVQEGTLDVAAAGAAALLTGGAFLTMAPKVLEGVAALKTIKAAIGAANPETLALAGTAGAAGVAIGGLAAVVGLAYVGQKQYDAETKSLAGTLNAATGAVTSNTRAMMAQKLQQDGVYDQAKKYGVSVQQVTSAALGNKSAIDQVTTAVQKYNDAQKQATTGGKYAGEQQQQQNVALINSIQGYADQTAKAKKAIEEKRQAEEIGNDTDSKAVSANDSVASALKKAAAASDGTKESVQDLNDAVSALFDQFFSVSQASDAFQKGLNDFSKSVQQNGKDLQGSTDGAIANRAALEQLVQQADTTIQKMEQQGASYQDISDYANHAADQIQQVGAQSGFAAGDVQHYTDQLRQVPQTVATEIKLDDTAATGGLSALARQLLSLKQGITVPVAVGISNKVAAMSGRATGGAIHGPGTGTSDTAGAFNLSNGEHVLTADDVHAMGGQDAVYRYRAGLHSGAGHKATGGAVGRRGVAMAARAGAAADAEIEAGKASTTPSVVTSAAVMAGLTATTSPLTIDAYTKALNLEAGAAARAATAQARLTALQQADSDALQKLQADQQQAESDLSDKLSDQLSAMTDALSQLKDADSQALTDQKNTEKARIDAMENAKASAASIRAQELADTKADQATSSANAAKEKAAQDAITAAKAANAKQTAALAAADKAAQDTMKDSQTAKETAAQDALTKAQQVDSDATDELTAAQEALQEQQEKALELAQQVAAAIEQNATLTNAYSDTTVTDLDTAGTALLKASQAAEAANQSVRGETADAALARRSQTLSDLASAAASYAASQQALGISDTTIQAGLDQVSAKVRDLGAAYGLTADQVSDLTSTLDRSTKSGADVLASMQRQVALAQTFAADVQNLTAAGLNSTLLQQIIQGGTTTGLSTAAAILSGGSDLIGQLNATQAQLDAAANQVATVVSSAQYAPGYVASATAVPSSSAAITATLDAQSAALLQSVATAMASRPVELVAARGGTALAASVNQANAVNSFGVTA